MKKARFCREITGKINGLLASHDGFDYRRRIVIQLPHGRRCLALAVGDASMFQAAKRKAALPVDNPLGYLTHPTADGGVADGWCIRATQYCRLHRKTFRDD